MKRLALYAIGMVWSLNVVGNVFLWRWVAGIRSDFPFESGASVTGVRVALVFSGVSLVIAGIGVCRRGIARDMVLCSVLMLQTSSIIHIMALVVEFVMVTMMRWE